MRLKRELAVGCSAALSLAVLTTACVSGPKSNSASGLRLTCRLPVVSDSFGAGRTHGFLNLGSGRFETDPSVGGTRFDAQTGRWFETDIFSPDHRFVALESHFGRLDIMDTKSGKVTRILADGVQGVEGWAKPGILVKLLNLNGYAWVNPSTSSQYNIGPAGINYGWDTVRDNAVWGYERGPGGFERWVSMDVRDGKMDVRNGKITIWSDWAALGSRIGFDPDGHPVSFVYPKGSDRPQVSVIERPRSIPSVLIDIDPHVIGEGQPSVDIAGVWIAGVDGYVYLWRWGSGSHGLRKIGLVPTRREAANDRNVADFDIAGSCA